MSLMITIVVLFAATNIDDIFLLLTWFSQRGSKLKTSHIIIGQYLGFITLVLLSVVGALGAFIFPQHWIGLLGLVPIYLGVKAIVEWLREQKEKEDTEFKREGEVYTTGEVSAREETIEKEETRGIFKYIHPSIYKVAAVTFANGGDNLGVYIPFFATYKGWQIGLIVITFLLLIAVWCFIAIKLISFPMVAKTLEKKFGHIIVPFVLIGLGILILHENGTISYFILDQIHK